MIYKPNNIFKTIFLLTVVLLGGYSPAQAAMDLSVVPIDGGTTIRFSRGDLNTGVTKEVRVRITSSDNVQYQVFQQLISPLTNERGAMINRPALTASILSGSNGSGTAYVQSFEPINMGQQLLFTSSPNGMSESFTLVYKVDPLYMTDSGSFTGLLQYVLQPVSGGARQSVQTNVFIESNAELTVNAEGSTAKNLVRVDTKFGAPPAVVNVSFNGNSGGAMNVYQEVLTFPVNDLNSDLASGILTMSAQGAQSGDLSFQSVVEIPRNRALIYRSTQSSDSFSIRYALSPDKLAGQRAGHYRGAVRFSFETDRMHKDFDIDLDINIAPLFEIVMDFPRGPVSFTSVLPGSQPQEKEVDVKVNSNLGKPYTVIQKIGQLMANEKGAEIPGKYYTVRQELNEGVKGRAASSDFVPVETGDQVIFYSDSKGSPAEFKVFYRLSPFPGMQPGDYKTAIVYTLGEL